MHTRLALGLAIAASISVLPLTAAAQQDSLAVSEASTNSAQIVVRDADSGKLRAATADEAAALGKLRTARSGLRAIAAAPQVKFHGSGATGVRVAEDMMSYSVVTRGADGKLVEQCFASKDEAEAAIKNGVAPVTTALPTE
ncbi:post-PEP-CTERM-1 domain-containing protein [Burkholderiaceae bacterium UC74_6]